MTYKNATLHPAMTALAAVLAFSSTASLAQTTDDPAVTATPAVETAPVPVVVEPVAPETATEPATAVDPLAPKAEAAPARKATAATRARPTAALTRPARPATPEPALATATPAPAIPVQEPVATTEVPTIAATAPDQAPAEASMNEMLPAAGIGAGILLLLTGAGVALRRRRRFAQSEEFAWQDETGAMPAEPAPIVATPYEPVLRQPAFVAAPVPAPVAAQAADLTPVEGPTTTLPEGFDLSRFSANVQAAYRGPTEDNPSLSLKHRLRKASAMDQMERNAAEAAPAAAPAPATQATGEFMLARARKPAMRPLHTH